MNTTIKETRWVIKEADELLTESLIQQLNINPILCKLLA
jgi:hypothetical protein